MTTETARALEAIVMVADHPVPTDTLASLTGFPPDHVESLLEELAASYAAQERGFELVRVAGGWRFQSHPDMAPYIERFVLEGQSARLSAAALETLAIVAYRQPVTRAEIEAIRGVGCEDMLRQLMERDFAAIGGRTEDLGRPNVYVTTRRFLQAFGLARIEDLPPIDPVATTVPPATVGREGDSAGAAA